MSLVLRLVVGCVLIVASACQASVHDGKVLVGQREVEHEVRLKLVEELLQLLHVVGVDFSGLDVHLIAFSVYGLYELVAFSLVMAGNHKLREDVLVLDYLKAATVATPPAPIINILPIILFFYQFPFVLFPSRS